MATVKMKKGNKFADICDSEETIRQAQLEGWALLEEKKQIEKEESLVFEEEKTSKKTKKNKD